jgi:virginiamycin A acetyltransferase
MPIPCGPDPNNPFPLPEHPRLAYLKNHVTRPNIIVGDYTYYDDPAGVANFEANVLYHFDFVGDKLIIGKFCAVATAVKFIMNGGNHNIRGFSSYPFAIFGGDCRRSSSSRPAATPWSATTSGSATTVSSCRA